MQALFVDSSLAYLGLASITNQHNHPTRLSTLSFFRIGSQRCGVSAVGFRRCGSGHRSTIRLVPEDNQCAVEQLLESRVRRLGGCNRRQVVVSPRENSTDILPDIEQICGKDGNNQTQT